jgi:hypothetical protein
LGDGRRLIHSCTRFLHRSGFARRALLCASRGPSRASLRGSLRCPSRAHDRAVLMAPRLARARASTLRAADPEHPLDPHAAGRDARLISTPITVLRPRPPRGAPVRTGAGVVPALWAGTIPAPW